MLKQKLSETKDIELAETEDFVLKGIDASAWVDALEQSHLDRFEEEKIKKTAQQMCLKYKTSAKFREVFTEEICPNLPKNPLQKRITLMTCALTSNYLRLKERNDRIAAHEMARQNTEGR